MFEFIIGKCFGRKRGDDFSNFRLVKAAVEKWGGATVIVIALFSDADDRLLKGRGSFILNLTDRLADEGKRGVNTFFFKFSANEKRGTFQTSGTFDINLCGVAFNLLAVEAGLVDGLPHDGVCRDFLFAGDLHLAQLDHLGFQLNIHHGERTASYGNLPLDGFKPQELKHEGIFAGLKPDFIIPIFVGDCAGAGFLYKNGGKRQRLSSCTSYFSSYT